MAKSRKRNTKKKSKNSREINWSQLYNSTIHFFKNERVQFIIGVLTAFAGIFILLSIFSFFFTGSSDSSIVNSLSYKEYVNYKSEETAKPEISNWMGSSGAYISNNLVNNSFGVTSILIPFLIVIIGLKAMKVSKMKTIKIFFITTLGLIMGSVTEAFIFGYISPLSHIKWGGTHGAEMEGKLYSSLGLAGMIMLVLLFIIISLVLLKKSSMSKIQKTIINNKPDFGSSNKSEEFDDDDIEMEIEIDQGYDFDENIEVAEKNGILKKLRSLLSFRRKKEKPATDDINDTYIEEEEVKGTITEETANNFQPVAQEQYAQPAAQESVTNGNFEVIVPEEDSIPQPDAEDTARESQSNTQEIQNNPAGIGNPAEEMEDYDPKKDLSTFEFPTMNLLKVYNTSNKAIDMEEQNENKNRIITTLRNYGIEITSIKATVGPTITLYEIIPQAGVRISKIRNLEDDIALSLSALGIRIIAPMPGKGTIGIEVPNKDPQIVSMQSVIASKRFQECTYDLPVALGKTITNEVFMFDLAKMPHLLVAGATGQGKSVGLNAIITSLLYKKHPSELKMVLIDPKMVEFNIYSTIEKHYLAKLPDHDKAIITDVSKVTQTLNSLTQEMDDRYELLMRAKVRTIKEYNEKFVKRRLNPNNGHRYLPYIVVVIDEFGDLIMTAGKEIEMPIARIAQKARAVGMHMVIATQRPTTNIITGTIKANFPARMAFRVTSQIDSRTILDASGANQLIGRGDMLFSQGSHLVRIQCAFVDTPEVEDITQYIGNQRGYESAFELPEVVTNEPEDKQGLTDLSDRDVLFEEAARLIVIHQQGSTSLIQRKFSVGYNRAGRLMDQLESTGIVGPAQGSKPRDVYVQDEYTLEKLLDSLR